MKKTPSSVLTGTLLLVVALLAGCSTTVRGSKKLDAYDQKISSPGVMWQSNPKLSLQIRKTAGLASLAEISSGNIADARENLGALLRILTRQGTSAVSARLNANGVLASTLANDAVSVAKSTQYVIKVFPDFAGSQCSALGCSHDVGLIVTVTDLGLKKTVWQGDFKVGAPMGGPVTDKLLDSFADSVVSELQKANLI
jgi:hypothetical protein